MATLLINHKLVKTMASHSNLITEENEKVDVLTDRPRGPMAFQENSINIPRQREPANGARRGGFQLAAQVRWRSPRPNPRDSKMVFAEKSSGDTGQLSTMC